MRFFTTTLSVLLLMQGLVLSNRVLAQSVESQCESLYAYIGRIDAQITQRKLQGLGDEGDIRSNSRYSHLSPDAKQRLISIISDGTYAIITELQALRDRQVITYKANCVNNTPTEQEVQYSCPTHSQLSYDGESCECDDGYEVNATGKYCVRIQYEQPKYEYESQPTTTLPPDVPISAWFADEALALVRIGVLSDSKPLRPSDIATRGELISSLVMFFEIPLSFTYEVRLSEPSFDDVPALYIHDFAAAALKGWIRGENDCYGTHPCFGRPDSPINRAEAAAIISRAFDLTSLGDIQFSDISLGMWYTESIQKAAANCILQGDPDGRVRPGGNMNRAEMIVMIHRAGQRLKYPNCG